MRCRLLEEQPRTCALILDAGGKLAAELKRFAWQERLGGGSFQAIGRSGRCGWGDSAGNRSSGQQLRWTKRWNCCR
jgi:predicted DNA-binding protein with PD1-like motif